MADVKWIKLTTNMFDNRKIKHLRRLPEGNSIVLIWVMLLTMAGRCNANGMIFLTENIPYTPKMLADELDFEESTVQLALTVLSQLNMIVTDGSFFSIAGWEEYQNIDRLAEIREYNRIAKQKEREKKKALQPVNDMSMTSQRCQAIEEDKERRNKKEDKEIKEIHKEKDTTPQQIVDLFNAICVSFPSVRSLSEARKKAIKARLNTYTLDDFRKCFELAETSSFLKGANPKNWSATFDWLIKDANMPKVLEGNYAEKPQQGRERQGSFDPRAAFERAVARSWEKSEKAKTAADDAAIRERMEALKEQLGQT